MRRLRIKPCGVPAPDGSRLSFDTVVGSCGTDATAASAPIPVVEFDKNLAKTALNAVQFGDSL
jgi:hypothetical protein